MFGEWSILITVFFIFPDSVVSFSNLEFLVWWDPNLYLVWLGQAICLAECKIWYVHFFILNMIPSAKQILKYNPCISNGIPSTSVLFTIKNYFHLFLKEQKKTPLKSKVKPLQIYANCCFCELALKKIQLSCLLDIIILLNIMCSRHELVEKLLIWH
jgi:hypothetical protein